MRAPPDETIEIPAPDGRAVRGDLYLPSGRAPSGIVVLCHGFKGYRTWGFLPYLAGRLRDAGIASLPIDFSHNGRGPDGAPAAPAGQSSRYPRGDLFRLNTIRRECDDLGLVIAAVRRNGLRGLIPDRLGVGVFGHSRGSVAAMIGAAEHDDVRALCTWSSPAHPDHFTAAQKERWRRWGEYDFTDAVDGARLCLSVGYLEDLEANHEAYDLVRRAATLRTPHLVVHGGADLAVSVESARALHDAERELHDKKLVILKAGHTFGVSDPPGLDFEDPPAALVAACEVSVEWFGSHFEKGL